MRISRIIIESFKLPLKRYKLFILSFILAVIFEYVTHIVYRMPLGDWALPVALIYSVFAFIIFGVILNLSNVAILEEKFEFDFKELVMESLKEYVITLYYLFITFVVGSFFVIHMGFYDDFLKIKYSVFHGDYGNAILSTHELVHQLPLSMQVDFMHAFQLNVLIILAILIFFSSLGFIGKVVAIKSDDFLRAFDLRFIFSIIKEIGYFRYFRFLLVIVIIAVILVNIIMYLEGSFTDVLLSAFLEVFVLFIIINAFYMFIDDVISDESF